MKCVYDGCLRLPGGSPSATGLGPVPPQWSWAILRERMFGELTVRDIDEVRALLNRIDWRNAIVKYMRFESPTAVHDSGIFAFECLGNLEVALETTDSKTPLLLLRCRDVYECGLSLLHDLHPRIESTGGRIRLWLLGAGNTVIEAEAVEVYALSERHLESATGNLRWSNRKPYGPTTKRPEAG